MQAENTAICVANSQLRRADLRHLCGSDHYKREEAITTQKLTGLLREADGVLSCFCTIAGAAGWTGTS